MRVAGLVAALSIATLGTLSCGGASAFACLDNDQCEGGVCTDTGYCAFEDVRCGSGLRYGDHAGDGLAGECVPEVVAGSTGHVGDDTGPGPGGETGGDTVSDADDGSTASNLDEDDGGSSETGASACSTWWDDAWERRRALSIADDLRSPGTNFPVALRVGEDIPDSVLSQSAVEVRFVDADCNVLPHEIEFSTEGEPLVLWVGFPTDEGAAAVHMYYGNPGAQDAQHAAEIWDDGFFGVWHLANLGDASGQMHTLEPAPEAIDGPLGVAGFFDGIDDFTQVPAALGFSVTGAEGISVSAWIRLDSAPPPGDTVRIVDKADGLDASLGFSFNIRVDPGGAAELEFDRGLPKGELAFATEGTPIALGQWHHVGATFDGAQPTTFYVDGMEIPGVVTAAGTQEPEPDDSIPITIGAAPYSDNRFFEGGIDEVRVSAVVRSPTWMAAEYLAGTGALVVVGPQQTLQ